MTFGRRLAIWLLFLVSAVDLASAQANTLRIISYVTPEYPPLALTAHIYGQVTVDLTLKQDGSVLASKVVTGHPMLQAAAVENSKTWKFTASNGLTADEHLTVTYEYKLEGEAQCGRRPVRVTFESYDHVTLVSTPVALCDPAATLKRKHWYRPW